MSLDGRVALVTGASRGIGRAVAHALAAKGVHVALNYRSNQLAALAVAAELDQMGAPASLLCQADISDAEQVNKMVATIQAELGPVDLLVNNAGIQRSGMAHRLADADWDQVIATNLSGPFYCSRAVLPSMRSRGHGQIINVASASSYVAQRGVAGYIASKHGLIGLTKALALENANKGIRVNAIAPGLTETDLVADLTEPQRQHLMAMVPLGRMATPDEVAQMVLWVIEGATYSTGNVFQASGGVYLG